MNSKTWLSPIEHYRRALCTAWIVSSLCVTTFAQDSSAEKKPEESIPQIKPEPAIEWKTVAGQAITIVLEGLNNPTAVAIQPETGIPYVADSGNGQVVRIVEGKAEPVITEFPKEPLGTTPSINIGPLSLAFLDSDTLVVGSGGEPAGSDAIRTYTLPTPPTPTKYDSGKVALTLPPTDPALPAEGNFLGLAVSPTAIFATSQGESNKGWVNVGNRSSAESVDKLERHIPTMESTDVPLATGITVTPHGYLLVTSIGGLGPEKDSIAAFFEVSSKRMLLKMQLDLHDVTAIAYSARRQMYAVDMAWTQADAGGVYRIIEDKASSSGLKAKLIAKLPHPTAMCFDSDGALYVTLRGAIDDKGNSQGMLVRIPSDENL